MPSFSGKVKQFISPISSLRVLHRLLASALYCIPPLRRAVVSNVAEGRSADKMDPAYDLGLYQRYTEMLKQYHRGNWSTMLDFGSGDGVIHAVQWIKNDSVGLFYLIDEFMFPQVIHAKIDAFLPDAKDRADVAQHIHLGTTLNEIPDGTLDVALSTSLFEHVLREEVPTVVKTLYTKLDANGTAIISIDLRDHYDFTRPFFFYRYAPWLWKLMTIDRSKYTNRLRSPDFLRAFKEAGFTVAHSIEEYIDAPLPKKMAPEFTNFDDKTLHQIQLIAVLRKGQDSANSQ